MILGNPTLIPASAGTQPQAPAPSRVPTTLQLFSSTVAVGGQETALVTTAANASVTLVITYADGSQQVIGPKRAGADGHFAYMWTVAAGESGTVRVVAVSSGVAQASFSIR